MFRRKITRLYNNEPQTAKQWFSHLPATVCKKAINYTETRLLDKKYTSIENAIACSFSISKSEEGFDYWNKVVKEFYKKEKK